MTYANCFILALHLRQCICSTTIQKPKHRVCIVMDVRARVPSTTIAWQHYQMVIEVPSSPQSNSLELYCCQSLGSLCPSPESPPSAIEQGRWRAVAWRHNQVIPPANQMMQRLRLGEQFCRNASPIKAIRIQECYHVCWC